MVARLYRRVVPRQIRAPLGVLRSYVFDDAETRKNNAHTSLRIDLYRSIGRTIVRKRLQDGTRIYVDLQDRYSGSSLFRGWSYEPAETAFVSRLLRPGMAFVDIGANIGYYSLLAARLIGPSGRVLSFEPDSHTHGLLVASVRLNGWGDRVVSRNVALSSAPGELILWKSKVNLGDHRLGDRGEGRTGVPVTVDTFDQQFRTSGLTKTDLLKIDVQGWEAKVFYGMSETLSRTPPRTMMMEFWPHGIRSAGDDPEKLLRWLMGYGYRFGVFSGPDGATRPANIDEVFAAVPPFNPKVPDASYVNIVLMRDA